MCYSPTMLQPTHNNAYRLHTKVIDLKKLFKKLIKNLIKNLLNKFVLNKGKGLNFKSFPHSLIGIVTTINTLVCELIDKVAIINVMSTTAFRHKLLCINEITNVHGLSGLFNVKRVLCGVLMWGRGSVWQNVLLVPPLLSRNKV